MPHRSSDQSINAATGARARLLAMGALAAGLGVGWFFGFQPFQEAQTGAAHVQYAPKAFLLAPMLMISGLFLLVGGAPVLTAFSGPPQGRQQHLVVWSILAMSLVAGGLAWWWLDRALHGLGYVTSYTG